MSSYPILLDQIMGIIFLLVIIGILHVSNPQRCLKKTLIRVYKYLSWNSLKIFTLHPYLACLNKLAFQARNPGTICCPTCKTETPLFPRTFESVRNLPKNFGVLEILESKEEDQTESIQQEKEKNKYLCPEHDEALKVYCYTCNCLICIYCQVLIFVCLVNWVLIALSCHCTICDNNPHIFSSRGLLD